MYREAPAGLPYVTAWRDTAGPGGRRARVLPDGCLDVIWADGAVFVAGPDTAATVAVSAPGTRYAALRFAAGTGPAVLGVPAGELTDRRVPLADLWPAARVRRIAEAADPAAALLAAARRDWRGPDPATVALARLAAAGGGAAAAAAALGVGVRQLHRRCVAAFGYGPATLARVLRLQRAVALARAGRPFAAVAADAGYADQPHLAREVRALAGVPLGVLLRESAGRAQSGA